MKTCKDSIDVLLQYLDGELPAEDAAALESHLGCCTPCVEFLRTYRATTHLCKRALAQKMPESVTASLDAFLKERLGK
ncbi:MAG: zf-HC2 domain-containing protein [Deltaproteobacteria bacterium]|nr:zf-HC2 domain-containing protein [Deltaproteobacteria bacterium]